MGLVAEYIDSTTFTVSEDKTNNFIKGRRIKANCGLDGIKYSHVIDSSYDSTGNKTIVNINDYVLTSSLREVWWGIVSPGDEGSIPLHTHDSDSQGGEISEDAIDHNLLYNYEATEHIDWTVSQDYTVDDDNIQKSSITQYNYTQSDLGIDGLLSINDVSNQDGNIDLVNNNNVTITSDDSNNKIFISVPDDLTVISNYSTDDLSEGSSNLYFTTDRIDDYLIGGNNISYSLGNINLNITSNVDFKNTYRAVNVVDPDNNQDVATKKYVDSLQQGLDVKESVRAATNGSNIDLTSSVDPNPIDDVYLNDTDRVLLKDQDDSTENGIYIADTASDPTTWYRSPDADSDGDITAGLYSFVAEGTRNRNRGFVVTTNDPIEVGTTGIKFTQFSGAGQITAGTGLGKDADTIYHNSASVHEAGGTVEVHHDNLAGFLSNEHIDWTTGQDTANVHDNNIQKTSITQYNYTQSDLGINGLLSIDGVSNQDGDVDLVNGGNVTINPDNTNNEIIISVPNDLTVISNYSTDDVSEGNTNIYYTDERVDDRVNNLLVSSDAITLNYDDAANTLTIGESHSARTDNPHDVTAEQVGGIVSVDGVSNAGGNIDLINGGNVTITADDTANTITISVPDDLTVIANYDTDDLEEGTSNLYFTTDRVDAHLSGGSGINYDRGVIFVDEPDVDHDSLDNFVATEHIDHNAVNINSGGILSGGGDLTADRTISLQHSDVDHDKTTNFLENEHIDWTVDQSATNIHDGNIQKSSITQYSYTQNDLGIPGLLSIDGVSNQDGNVDLNNGGNVTITPDNANNTITFSVPDDLTVISNYSTDDVSEGSSNLYYTEERVDDRVSNLLVSSDAITLDYDDLGNTLTIGESHSARTDNPHNVTAFQAGALISVDGVSNSGGNVDLVNAGNVTITPNDIDNQISFSVPNDLTVISNYDTDDLDEGANNLYFTTSRIDTHLSGGSGIIYNTGNISVDEPDVDHDNLDNFVVNEHINHSDVSITTTGILSGGSDITSDVNIHLESSDVDHDQTTNFLETEHRQWENSITQNIHDDNITSSSVTQHETDIDHDNLTNFELNEHIDWTIEQGAANIHDDNIQKSSITQYDYTQSDLGINAIQSINNVTNQSGNIDLINAGNVTITPDDGSNEIALSVPNDLTVISNYDTDDVSEGDTNLYFTTDRIDAHLSGGSNIAYNTGLIELDITSNVDFKNSYKITNLINPTNDQDVATKYYVDSIEQGLDPKDSVRAATDGTNIDLTSNTDPNPIDGIFLSDGDRVLLKDQSNSIENGIYISNTAADPTTWVRSEDANSDTDVTSGLFTFIEEGNRNNNRGFIITTKDPITLGTTEIHFTQFSGAGQITAGIGINKDADTLNHDPATVHEAGGAIEINHDSLAGFVANEHIDHSDVSITTTGILSGSGNLTSDITISLNSTDVDHDQTTNFLETEHRQWENSITQNIHDDNIQKSSITQYDYTQSDLGVNGLTSIDGVSNQDGDVDLINDGNVTITPDDTNNQISFSVPNDLTVMSNYDTDDLDEGTNNLYFTTSRIDTHLSGGSGIIYNTGVISVDESVVNHDELQNYEIGEHIDWTVDQDTTNIHDNNIQKTAITQYDYTQSELGISGLLSVDGVSNQDGDVDFVNGGNVTITPDDTNNQISFSVPNDLTVMSNYDTDDLSEGTGNLYFTTARVDNHLSGGNNISYSTGTINLDITSDVDFKNSYKITNLVNPDNDQDVATKYYVDSIEQGLDLKHSVRAATDGTNIDLSSSTDPNPIDDVYLNDNDRVLLKDQTDAAENGIYNAVTAADPSSWVRSPDADEDTEVTAGLFTFVEEGTTNNNKGFVLVTNDAITLGSTDINFTQFSGAGQITAGTGLNKVGDTLNHDDGSVHEAGGAVEINHDSLAGFVANEHIDHSTVSITTSGILSGGGDLTTNRDISLTSSDIDHDQTTNFVSNEHVDHSGITVAGGTGLSGGGDLTSSRTINLDATIGQLNNVTITSPGAGSLLIYDATNSEFVNSKVTAGTGISKTEADGSLTISTDDANINHDNLQNYIAKEHIDWTADQSGSYTFHDNNLNKTAVTQYNYTQSDLGITGLLSVDGVSNQDGDIDLVNGGNVTITPDNDNNKITISVPNDLTVISNYNTDDLTEGASNLYFTTSRIDTHLSGGSGIDYDTGVISVDEPDVDHNSLSGLQGGTSAEYFHLTSSEYSTVIQPATSSQDGYLTAEDFERFDTMATSGGTNISHDETLIIRNTDNINFIGDLNVIDDGDNSVTVDITKVKTPVIISPNEGETSVKLTPTIKGDVFSALYPSIHRDYRQFQIDYDTGDFSNPIVDTQVDSDSYKSGTRLDTLILYKARIRDVTTDGYTTYWSEPVTFETTEYYVDAPTLTVDGASTNEVPYRATMSTSSFNIANLTGGTHVSTDWRVIRTSDEVVIHENLNDSENLTSYKLPWDALDTSTEYRFEVRHNSENYGGSQFSTVTATTLDIFVKPMFSGGDGQEVHKFNGVDTSQLDVYSGHNGSVTEIVFGEDDYLYSADDNHEIHKIDPETMSNVDTYTGHGNSVHALCWGWDGYLYSTDANSELHKVDPKTMTLSLRNDSLPGQASSVTWGGNGYVYIGEGTTNAVIKIDPSTLAIIKSYKDHSDDVFSIVWGSTGYIYSASKDNTVHKIEPNLVIQLAKYTGHGDTVRSIAWGADGYLYSGSKDDEVHKIDPVDMLQVDIYTGHSGNDINSVTWGANGYLYSGDQNGDLHKIDPTSMTQESVYYGHSNTITTVTWNNTIYEAFNWEINEDGTIASY